MSNRVTGLAEFGLTESSLRRMGTREVRAFVHLRTHEVTPAAAVRAGLCRALVHNPTLLLLDDPFIGLSPKFVKRFCGTFRTLRKSGMTLFIAGQHVRRILNVADIAFLIEDGTVTLSGPGPGILHNHHLQKVLFGTDM